MTIDLRPFGTSSRDRFARHLDRTTERLMHALPTKARSWGIARKLLNIFLRNCLYNWHLRQLYQLERSERFLEVPLDSITAKALCACSQALPRWQQTQTPRLPRHNSYGKIPST